MKVYILNIPAFRPPIRIKHLFLLSIKKSPEKDGLIKIFSDDLQC